MAHVAFPFEKFKLHPQYLVLVQNAVFLKKLAGKIALPTDFLLKFMIHYSKNLDAKLFFKKFNLSNGSLINNNVSFQTLLTVGF